MIWPFTGEQEKKRDIELLKQRSEEIVKHAQEYEQAALDGEEHWMLVKCKKKKEVAHPIRRETDAVCVT